MTVDNNAVQSADIHAGENMGHLAGKYLTFKLGSEEYGINIANVREINVMMDIDALPNIPPYIKGVINLRGKIIPIIDLRLKFGIPPADYTKETCIIVIDVDNFMMGIVVDTVSEVMDMEGSDIDPAPRFGSAIHTEFILGLGKTKDGIKILLDIKKVFGENEFEKVEEIYQEVEVEELLEA